MPAINLSLMYRPVRIGFLVRDSNTSDIVKAAGLNSLLWGGFCNPLIPVGDNKRLTKYLIDVFSVDVLIPAVDAPELARVVDEHKYLHPPNHWGDPLFTEEWRSKKKLVKYLDVLNAIEANWEREFRHVAEDYKSECALVHWDASDEFHALFSILFGFYGDLGTLHDFEHAFLAGMKAKELTIANNAAIDVALDRAVTPMTLTRLDLFGFGGGRLFENGIYLGEERSFVDLISFWNLRASGASIRFLSVSNPERCSALVRTHLDRLDKQRAPNPNIEDRLSLYYRDDLEGAVKKLAEDFKTNKPKLWHRISSEMWNGLNVKPTIYHFGHKKALASLDDHFGFPSVNFGLPEKDFLAKRANRSNSEFQSQLLAVSTNFHTDYGYEGATLHPPCIRALNEFYSREICTDPWKLRVEDDGIAVIEDIGCDSISLRPLSHQAIVNRVFEHADIEAKMSHAGALTSEIIGQMRESSALEACRVFKIRGVRALLSELSPESRIPWDAAIRRIGKEEFEQFKDLYIASREKRELEPADALNFLLEKRILAPRLRLWHRLTRRHTDYNCARCGLKSRIPMAAFEGFWQCQYCEHRQHLAPLIGANFRNKRMWEFKKRGLFAKSNHQEGAIPVILTLLALNRILDRGGFVHTTSLNLKGEKPCETDLCVMQFHRGEEIEIGIGECKSRGRITKTDVENLLAQRSNLEAVELSCHLIFSKSDEDFGPEEIALFEALKKDHVPFILFTRRELEPYHPYWGDKEKEQLPFPHAFKMSEMALNSEFRYLPRRQAPNEKRKLHVKGS